MATRKLEVENDDNQGLGQIEFHNRPLQPEERGEIRAMLALYRYEQQKKLRSKERWQTFSLLLGVPTAIGAFIVILDKLWTVLTKGH